MKTRPGRLTRWISFAVLIAITFHVAQAYGVREKTFWEKFQDIFASGVGGALFGILGFALLGTIGWVAGPIYGAIGIFSYLAIGTGAGLGFGSLIHIASHHEDYVFSFGIIIPILIVGWAISSEASKWLGEQMDQQAQTKVLPAAERVTVVIERPKAKILRPVLTKTVRIEPPESSRQLPGNRDRFLH